MARLKLRQLVLKKKPYGKFNYKVLLERRINKGSIFYKESNASSMEELRIFLRDAGNGAYRFDFQSNYKNRRVYKILYLENKMDLTMLKLIYPDKLYKIYKIKVLGEEV